MARLIDAKIQTLAARTASVVHARDLRAEGIERRHLGPRIAAGSIAPILPRTYAVGPLCSDPTYEMSCMAGVLHAGPGSKLDHETAATLLGVWDRGDGVIHVSSERGSACRDDPRFAFHRDRGLWLPSHGVSSVGPLPITGFADMCIRLAHDLTPWQLAYIIQRGRYRELVTLGELDEMVFHNQGKPGVAVLRKAIALVRSGSAGTRSRSEDEFLRLLRAAGIELPIVNTRGVMGIVGDEADTVWLQWMLNVEIDGRHHLEEPQLTWDRERDAAARALGWKVLRIRAAHVWTHPREVIRRVLAAMEEPRLRGWAG